MGLIYNWVPGDLETMIYLSVDSMDAIYDNSEAFSTFLRNQGIDHVLSVNRLKLRKNHKLVPHVCLAVRVYCSLGTDLSLFIAQSYRHKCGFSGHSSVRE